MPCLKKNNVFSRQDVLTLPLHIFHIKYAWLSSLARWPQVSLSEQHNSHPPWITVTPGKTPVEIFQAGQFRTGGTTSFIQAEIWTPGREEKQQTLRPNFMPSQAFTPSHSVP